MSKMTMPESKLGTNEAAVISPLFNDSSSVSATSGTIFII